MAEHYRSEKKKIQKGKRSLFFLPIVVTALLVLNWIGLPSVFKWLLLIYAAYRLIILAMENFTCGHCLYHFGVAFALVVFAWLKLSHVFYVMVLIAVWVEPLSTMAFGLLKKRHR